MDEEHRGGARVGAGRPAAPSTIQKRNVIGDKNKLAEKALAFLGDVMDNNEAPDGMRINAAIQIMDRVWGRPVQLTVTRNMSNAELKKLVFQKFGRLLEQSEQGGTGTPLLDSGGNGAEGRSETKLDKAETPVQGQQLTDSEVPKTT